MFIPSPLLLTNISDFSKLLKKLYFLQPKEPNYDALQFGSRLLSTLYYPLSLRSSGRLTG